MSFPSRQGEPPPAGAILALRGVTLRRATDEDLPFLQTLFASVRAEEMALVDWPAAAKAAFLESQFRLQHLSYTANFPDGEFLIVERRQTPIGRLYLARAPGEILIVDVSLLPGDRGKGVGSALVKRLAALARQERRERLALHVRVANTRARKLYDRLGFKSGPLEGEHQWMGLWVNL